MNLLSFIFRYKEDYIDITPYSKGHLIFLAIGLCLIIFTISFRKRKESLRRVFIKSITIFMIFVQIILYSWQYASGRMSLLDSLPIYSCRLVLYLFIFDVFFHKPKLRKICIYWGLMGGILAMLVPDLYRFRFPHITNLQFFIFHFYILMMSIYYICVENIVLTKEDLKYSIKVTVIYNIFVLLLSLVIRQVEPEVNYGFILRPPAVIESYIPFNGVIYTIMAIIVYSIVICIMHMIYKVIKRI